MTQGGGPRRNLPIFVARQTYRRRRLRDAARALPVVGVLLWMVPLLWPLGGDTVTGAGALIFVFVVWGGLVVVAAALVAALNAADRAASTPDPLDDGDDRL